MTYNSYSNYQRMHSLSGHSYIDGVPMTISDQFQPPPKIKLPRMHPRHVCDVIEQEYDFSLEKRVLAEAESRRQAETNAAESRRLAKLAEVEANRVDTAMEDLSRCDAESVPKDRGKREENIWTLGSEIMTPLPLTASVEVTRQPVRTQIRVKDFETVDDPFDDLELKVLDDMAELKSVLDVVQKNVSPKNMSPSIDDQRDKQGPTEVKAGSSPVNDENSVCAQNSIPSHELKRKPVDLADYNISLPNTDHLIDYKPPSRQSFSGTTDFSRYVTGRDIVSFPVTNCTYTGYDGCTNLISSKSDTTAYYTPSVTPTNSLIDRLMMGQNGTNFVIDQNSTNPIVSSRDRRSHVMDQNYTSSVISRNSTSSTAQNGTSPVNGGKDMTFDDYLYSGYKMRSARSATDLRQMERLEDDSKFSQSPPPRVPSTQCRRSITGAVTTVTHSPHKQMTSSIHLMTSLPDPFTSLNVEDQDFVCMFADMGFPRARAARAVQSYGKDAKQVTDFLCLCDGLIEQGYPPDHVELAARLAENQIKQAKEYLKVMKQLKEFGFAQSQIDDALSLHHTDTEKCLDYLTAKT